MGAMRCAHPATNNPVTNLVRYLLESIEYSTCTAVLELWLYKYILLLLVVVALLVVQHVLLLVL